MRKRRAMRVLAVLKANPVSGGPPALSARLVSFGLAVGLLSIVLCFSFSRLQYRWNWRSIRDYQTLLLQGWLVTVGLAVAALGLSLAIAMIVAMMRRSAWLPLQYLSRIYIESIRGTPLLVQILVFFYVIADAFGMENRYVVGTMTLSIFSGAYLAEIIRAGVESIGKSQIDSARAIGLTRIQIYRWVIVPQALRRLLPPMAGQFVSLVKDSSLLSIIGIAELTKNAQDINALTFSTLESYLPLAAGYLVLTLPISLWTQSLERRHGFET